jgi:methionyl-tRNA formyltransferase
VKTVFFGTPAIGVGALRALAQSTSVVGVVCQPDRPAGRGMQTTFCPIKQAALDLDVEVYQPVKVRDGALKRWLADKAPHLCVVFAYGRILPTDVLHTPPLGCINLHASLLPRWRGAAPIQWAIAMGDTTTGISLMQMDEGLDTGPVFTRRMIPIPDRCTGGELTQMIHDLAVDVVIGDLPLVAEGSQPEPQDHTLATHAPPIEKHHLALDFEMSARELNNRIRAFAPSPGAFCFVGHRRLKVLEVETLPHEPSSTSTRAPGTVIAAQGDLILVQTALGSLGIKSAQIEGKRVMSARDLINGRVLQAGQLLTRQAPEPA